MLDLGEGMSITFLGVDMGALSESNFLFDQLPVTTNAGSMVLGNGSIMPLSGIIENTGTISLELVWRTHRAADHSARSHVAGRRLAPAFG